MRLKGKVPLFLNFILEDTRCCCCCCCGFLPSAPNLVLPPEERSRRLRPCSIVIKRFNAQTECVRHTGTRQQTNNNNNVNKVKKNKKKNHRKNGYRHEGEEVHVKSLFIYKYKNKKGGKKKKKKKSRSGNDINRKIIIITQRASPGGSGNQPYKRERERRSYIQLDDDDH